MGRKGEGMMRRNGKRRIVKKREGLQSSMA